MWVAYGQGLVTWQLRSEAGQTVRQLGIGLGTGCHGSVKATGKASPRTSSGGGSG